jgi:TetR/AcrR family transcriptional regulator, lmrAB and yxaGH operons repressor
MGRSKREEIVWAAWRLFESQGYHATGINQIITESGVPKGSFYHYFPDGKEGLAVEAIDTIGKGLRAKVQSTCAEHDDPVQAIVALCLDIARHLKSSGFQHGGPLTIVTLETATTNERLNEACRRAYNGVHDELSDQLRAGSFGEENARALSSLILAALEGGILLSRTLHSAEPLEQIARQIEHAIRSSEQSVAEPAK